MVDLSIIPGYDPYHGADAYYFDETAAKRVIDFYSEMCIHQKGELAGKPFILAPWQQAVVANAFGWKHKDTHLRRYRIVWVYVPRKNGKSSMAAPLALYLTFCDGEPGAEVFSAAADRDQASLVYDPARHIVENNKHLSAACKIYATSKTMLLPGGSLYKAISADAYTKHGLNPHGVIFDEVHAQPNRELWDVLVETGTGARRQPLTFAITTADYERPSLCNKLLDYAEKVRDRIIDDPTFLPAIYAADREDDWTLEETWKKANPNYGVSLRPEWMKAQCAKAQADPSFENTFKRLNLNIKTEQDERLIQLAKWDACKPCELTDAELRQLPCHAGLDLALTNDITCFCPVWEIATERTVSDLDLGIGGQKQYYARPVFFVPDEHPEVYKLYKPWIEAGCIKTTPGDILDYNFVRHEINTFAKTHNLKSIAIDRWNAAQLTIDLCETDGLDVVGFGQGYNSMAEPTKKFLTLIEKGSLLHNGNPVLRWMASNAAGRRDEQDNIKIVKCDRQKNRLKVDGIIALIMALGLWISQPVDTGSIYEKRGLTRL